MPILNSGCRYFGRLTAVIAMTPCYLRTYTYLLQQQRAMLGLARAMLNDSNTSGCKDAQIISAPNTRVLIG